MHQARLFIDKWELRGRKNIAQKMGEFVCIPLKSPFS